MDRSTYATILKGVLILGFFSFSSLGFAQVTATMTGKATDPTGAVVPRLAITIANEATGATVRSIETNSQGYYSAPNLAVGRYTLYAQAAGFKSYKRTGIVLD